MNLAFDAFKFQSIPFGKDVPELFQYPQLEELHRKLAAAVQTATGVLVTGQAGTGKTTAVRGFVDTLPANKYKIIYLGYDQRGGTMFARLGLELGLKLTLSRNHRMLQITRQIDRAISGAGKKLILVIDEAHLLDGATLEDIRLLTNTDMDRRSDVIPIMLGQLWLRTKLKNHGHEALYQRLRFRYGLEGLTLKQARDYVAHHLRLVGSDPALFSESAVKSIFQASGGILREINNLCLESLLCASSSGLARIDHATVQQVLDERETS
jgi:general secretion pathway protein A